MAYVPTLKKMYKEQVVPALVKEFNYSSVMQVPVLEKIVINQGLGQAIGDKKILETAIEELTKITGQRAVTTRSKKFDGQGNYTLGITEQIIFPEIDIDKINKILGMEITFVTTAKTDEEAYALLKQFGLPFKNAKKNA